MEEKEKQDYLVSSFKLHILLGKSSLDAWLAAAEDFKAVYCANDDRSILARAAEVALQRLQEKPAAEK